MSLQERLPVWSVSLGCPKNRVDTERCLGSLGCTIVPVERADQADLVLINTCAFIESAVRESLKTIFDALEACKDAGRSPLFVVAGCLVGRYGKATLAGEITEVDLWLETASMAFWPSMIQERLFGQAIRAQGRLLSTGPSYAWLKIGEGCRHRCAFCTIPQIRGPLVSDEAQALREEAKTLVDKGVRELVLVAQDVSAWGSEKGKSLCDLLPTLAEIDDLTWLRLLYLYPSGISEALLTCMRDIGAPLLPYFDIPIQHVEPSILKAMGRPDTDDPRALLDRIHAVFPDAALRTSLIVGFPGETDEDFESLARFVEEGHCLHLGVFAYSAEEGTRAAGFPNQVPKSVATARRDRLMAIQHAVSRKKLLASVGSTLPVLIDSAHPEWPTLFKGRVWFQAPEIDGITYISAESSPGSLVQAEIVESIDYDLTALELP